MSYIGLNALQILAATLVGLAFGAAYHALTRPLEGAPEGGATRYGPLFLLTAFLAEFWLASILAGALILAPPGAGAWVMAVGSALVIWIGFVVPALVVAQGYRGAPARVVALDCGYWLVVMLAQAVVMKALGLAPPPG